MKKFGPKKQKKLVVLFVIILLAFVGLSIRLVWIYQKDGEKYKKQILSQQEYDSKTLPYKRGEILDANETKLAYSEKVYNLVVDARVINESKAKDAVETTISALSRYFQVDTAMIREHITQNKENQYYVVLKALEYEKVAPFLEEQGKNKSIVGVWFEEEYKRKYPYSTLAASVIGFTGSDNNGTFGLEEYYNSILNGTNGREYGYLTEDSTVERTTISAEDGSTIVTSIDVNIQSIVEKYIREFNEAHKGEYREGEDGSTNTGVIVMDPNTGNVLAMADYPSFDLNNPKDLTPFYTEEEIAAMTDEQMYECLNQIWRNYCISDTYEPGSVSKAMTIATGLDTGKLSGNESYNCEGIMEVSKHKIRCHKRIGHGTLSLSQCLEESCNMGLIQIANTVGKDTLTDYLYNFNIGLKTNIDLAGEARTNTLVYNPENMVASDLAISSFGQGYMVNMIQMTSAFSSIINGGKYYEPHVVTEIRNADGTTIEKIEPRVLKQTISSTTSDEMKVYLANVCSLGTGTPAVPAGYLIGGKTGTAEKQPRGTGDYVVSFMGYAPADDPQVVVYAVIDEPNVEDQPHSSFAMELVKGIFTEILPYMNVFRTEELTEEEIAELEALHIIPVSDNSIPADENNGVQYETDETTGYVIDPNTGELLDPDTYSPAEGVYSNLDGAVGVEHVEIGDEFSAGAGF
ncbi:MAG: peptidoglycan glycosyltransferase [Lachnospiraceae bacterium]|nr:peptidoglycan glycosyltransferase [Lachnospiraceae bacterium]